MKKTLSFSLLLLFLFANSVYSQLTNDIFILDSIKNEKNIENFSVIKDLYGNLTIDSILSDSYSDKFVNEKIIENNVKGYWIRTKISNKTGSEINLLFSLYPYEFIEAYYKYKNHYEVKRNGLIVSTNDRDSKEYFDVIGIKLLKDSVSTIYFHLRVLSNLDADIKIQSINAIRYKLSNDNNPKNLAIKVYNHERISEKLLSKWIELSIFLGFVAAMLLYNVMVMIYTRDRTYLIYNLMTFGIIVFYINYSNLTPYLFSLSFSTQESIRTFFGSAFINLGMVLFSKYYLNTKKVFPKWNILLNGFLISFILIIILRIISSQFVLFDIYILTKPLFNGVSFIITLSVLILSFFAYYKKYPSAVYFLIANISFYIFHLVFVLQKSFLGILSESWFTNSSLEIGYALQTILFSISLAARIRILKQEKEKAEVERIVELNRLAIAKNIELEELVANRTFELKQSNDAALLQRDVLKESEQKLKELNATKDKFFSIIAHDLRGPIGTLNSLISIIADNESKEDPNLIKEALISLKNSTKNTYDLLENLLKWALSQKGELPNNPSRNNINEIIQSNIQLFKATTENKKINVEYIATRELYGYFDYNMINSVVRNLFNNAIKYSFENGAITFNTKQTGNTIEVSIKDTGIGMDSNLMETLFRLDVKTFSKTGTKGEEGSGLGLILCKEFIEKQGGRIWVESEMGKGAEFIFTLPLAT